MPLSSVDLLLRWYDDADLSRSSSPKGGRMPSSPPSSWLYSIPIPPAALLELFVEWRWKDDSLSARACSSPSGRYRPSSISPDPPPPPSACSEAASLNSPSPPPPPYKYSRAVSAAFAGAAAPPPPPIPLPSALSLSSRAAVPPWAAANADNPAPSNPASDLALMPNSREISSILPSSISESSNMPRLRFSFVLVDDPVTMSAMARSWRAWALASSASVTSVSV
mmetsp:Transcript_60137/g.178319  ORF Transcript_60137/g.178319 Transcript_60137/m.178319 type:complete len:224 (-) Transcript_60137:137-808(-)